MNIVIYHVKDKEVCIFVVPQVPHETHASDEQYDELIVRGSLRNVGRWSAVHHRARVASRHCSNAIHAPDAFFEQIILRYLKFFIMISTLQLK